VWFPKRISLKWNCDPFSKELISSALYCGSPGNVTNSSDMLALVGEVNFSYLLKMIVCMYAWKMCFEIIGAPFANLLTQFIKKQEGVDPYDIPTNYNPFLL
jgi:hypothetical protein